MRSGERLRNVGRGAAAAGISSFFIYISHFLISHFSFRNSSFLISHLKTILHLHTHGRKVPSAGRFGLAWAPANLHSSFTHPSRRKVLTTFPQTFTVYAKTLTVFRKTLTVFRKTLTVSGKTLTVSARRCLFRIGGAPRMYVHMPRPRPHTLRSGENASRSGMYAHRPRARTRR